MAATMSVLRTLRQITLVAAVVVAVPSPAGAQYFGQNKVQYGDFDFQVLETPHFDIYFYSRERDAAREVARMAERWYGRLSSVLGAGLVGRQPVILYASHAEFEQTNALEGLISESTGGVTEGLARRVILPMAASLGESDHVLGHELVHAFQYSILGNRAEGLPLWFMEGMAEYLSLGNRDPQTAMWLRDALVREDLPTLQKLDDPKYFPYRFGHALWSFIGGRWGDRVVGEILHAVAGGGRPGGDDSFGSLAGIQMTTGDPIRVIELKTGMKREAFSTAWHEAIGALYRPGLADTANRRVEPAVVLQGEERGSLRIGPALSPDGSRLAYLSEQDRLSIELFVADARTGEVDRRLTKTTADPHFDSLHFVDSSGAWSPDGKQLVIAAAHDGHAELAFFSAENGRRVREIALATAGTIFQPNWSPDGQTIAVSAQVGGVTDLYLVDVKTGEVRALTTDLFADLQPAWAPNSRDIVFVTDRFGTDLSRLSFADYSLARINTETRAISQVRTGLSGNNVNPQWGSADELYFISDATGRPDVYRHTIRAGRTELVATAPTGIAGITPLSPALSVSQSAHTIAYSVFGTFGYSIQVHQSPPSEPPLPANAGDLARLPGSTGRSQVAEQLEQPGTHLPPATEYPVEEASAKLHLMDMSQAIGVSSSTGAFGTYVSGGIAFLFSDILGNHLLSMGVDVAGGPKNTAVQVAYTNRTSRWNWTLFGERVPLVSGTVTSGFASAGGQVAYFEQANLRRETHNQFGGLVAYPFSRTARVEFGASARHISFENELTTNFYNPSTGAFLGDETTDLSGSPSLNLGETFAALVRDASTFGAVSPVQGERFRFEVAPTFGGLTMVNTTLDYRRYVMPLRPVTLAGRLMHMGRYGMSAEDQRLMPIYLGYNGLVRGYDFNSFTLNECTITANGSCPDADQLIGSRALVANLEARVPLLGLFNGRLDYGPVPAELFGFFDAGTAWTRNTTPSFVGGTRDWVRSVGIGARVNLFGFAIGEFNLARPLDRGNHGWDFVFNFRPGF